MCKGVSGVKCGTFKKSQRDFLPTLFNNNGGPKIRERDDHTRIQSKFKDKDEDSDFCYRLVLSESQIKFLVYVRGRAPEEIVSEQGDRGRIHRTQSINRYPG